MTAKESVNTQERERKYKKSARSFCLLLRRATVVTSYQRLQALHLRLDVFYFDKGFCAGAVIRYLQHEQQPAVLTCTIHGTDGGSRQLCQGRKSYRTTYTFTDGTTAAIAVVATLPPGKAEAAPQMAALCRLSSTSTSLLTSSFRAIDAGLALSVPTASGVKSASRPRHATR